MASTAKEPGQRGSIAFVLGMNQSYQAVYHHSKAEIGAEDGSIK